MLEPILKTVREAAEDPTCRAAQAWAAAHPGAPLVGYLPAYAPRELVYAAGGLAVGIWGAGPGVEIVQGDAYFQSYICHLPRSVIEMAKQGVYGSFKGVVFPSICDVVRNLSGMWKILFPHQWVKYLDLPQNLDPAVGGVFYREELRLLAALILGRPPDDAYMRGLSEAIRMTNRQARLFDRLKEVRSRVPHKVPIDEYYYFFRGALVLHPEEHMRLLEGYLDEVEKRDARPMDNIRVVLAGAFCEQPPVGLLRTIERAGCYIVNHDLLLGLHWFTEPLDETGDPFKSLVEGYCLKTTMAPFKYQDKGDRGEALIRTVRAMKADGVILAAPSFCDPSLLERPLLQKALEKAGISFTMFKYAENTGQYQAIREQAGTFSDSVRLWGEEAVHE